LVEHDFIARVDAAPPCYPPDVIEFTRSQNQQVSQRVQVE